MLDLQFICENQEVILENCRNRGIEVDLEQLSKLDQRRRELIVQGDNLRQEQKSVSSQIPKAADNDARQTLIAQGKELREQISAIEIELREVESLLKSEQARVPNLAHPDVPVGKEDKANTVVRMWGEKPAFEFTPLDHVALAERHDLIDFEAGTRVAGHGFYYLKNEAVLLEMALCQYAMQKLVQEGFVLHSTPDLARKEILEGIGFNPRGDETQIYSVENTDLSLVATAEITLGGSMKDQIMDRETLPYKIAGLSHCFRTEAGAHGKATRGIYRVHQFSKVEMFAFTEPTNAASDKMHEEIVRIEEEIFQGLGLHYRVVDTCTGDLGAPAYRKYDLEAWMPGRGDAGEYGEVTSASNCTDYQSRRLGTRCKSSGQKGTEFVHTLNGTAVSIARAIIAVLENYQQADGTILVPEVLRPWIGKDQIG
jgi:seryl-tRNA synthetase